jgi:predicted dehydrogenase
VCERKSGPPLYQVPTSELVLVQRRNRDAGEDFARRHAGRYVESVEALVSSPDIDAVYVASPHALHAEHALAALRSGKHVLVEKPMALSAGECSAMIKAAEDNALSLAVAYYRRGYPSIRRIRQLLADGIIGAVTSMSINGEFPTSHRLDLAHFLLGDIESVRTVPGGTEGYTFERMAGRIQLRTASAGAEVTMSDTWTETGMPEALVIRGELGAIHLTDLKGGTLFVVRGTSNDQFNTGGLPFTHWGIVQNFTEHLLRGASLLCDGGEGRKSTVILDLIDKATPNTWTEVSYT